MICEASSFITDEPGLHITQWSRRKFNIARHGVKVYPQNCKIQFIKLPSPVHCAIGRQKRESVHKNQSIKRIENDLSSGIVRVRNRTMCKMVTMGEWKC